MPVMNISLVVAGVVLAVCGLFLAVKRRESLLIILTGLSLADAGYLGIALGIGGPHGISAALLLASFNGCARLLAFFCLRGLAQYAVVQSAGGTLVGIAKAKPVLALLFSFSMFAGLGISPFFTLEAKPFLMSLVLQTGSWLLPVTLTVANCVSVVMTLLAVHRLWLNGSYLHTPSHWREYLSDELFVPAVLAFTLLFMGIFGHAVIGFFDSTASEPTSFFANFALNWHPAVFVLYAGAFLVLCAGFVHEQARNILAVALPAVALVVVLADASLAPLGRFFAVIVSGVGLLVTLYSWGYMQQRTLNSFYYCLLLLMFGSLNGIVLSRNFGSFFVFWELMTLSSYVLVAWDNTDQAHAAARKYFIMCSVAAAIMLPGLLLFWSETGSLDIAMLSQQASQLASLPGIAGVVVFLVLVGCGVKAGLFPGHSWLPDAHPAAPSSISGPLSGVLTKAGLFGLFQVLLVVFGMTILSAGESGHDTGIPAEGWLLCGIGMITMLYGELMALRQKDLKRLLAYSTMGQIGEICMTLGLMSWLAAAGALMHVFNHAIMKDLLFLCSGALIMRAGSRRLADLSGLGKVMPFTAGCMVIGLLSILGLPPFAGFMSKFAMLYALADVNPLLAGVMLTASMAGCVYYTRIIKTLVFEPYRGPAVEEAPMSMRVATGILAGLCLVFGLYPSLVFDLVAPVFSFMQDFGTAGISAGAQLVSPLPELNWPFHTIILLLGAVVPVLLRKKPQQAGRATAIVLAVASLIIILNVQSMDILSFGFALFVTVIGCVNMVYSVGYMDHSHAQWRFYAFFLCMTAGLTGVAVSSDIFSFFVFWEIMSSWSLYFVIVHEENSVALREGFKYFFFNVLGAGFLFLAVVLVINWSGGAGFDLIKSQLPALGMWQKTLFFGLMATGFVMKAAQLPFRIDIQMHPASAPTPVSGYISSVLLKSALFGLVKLFMVLGGGLLVSSAADSYLPHIMHMVVWVGGITIVMAGVFAVFQDDLKLVLIYSTVSQLGYMVVGVALGTSLGIAGGLLHLVNHIFFKDLLFLVAGAVIVQTSRQSMSGMGGLGLRMPKTLALFCVGAVCVIGLPPSSGFTSKWILYHALMDQGYVVVAILSLVGSVLTLAYITKMLHSVFLGQPARGLEHVQEVPTIMLVPMNILAGGCIATSLFPGLVLLPLNSVLQTVGLAPLDIAPWGISSGAGAWNATLTAFMLALIWAGAAWLLKRLSVQQRVTEIHTCGIPAAELNSGTMPKDIYSAPLGLFRRWSRKHLNKGA